MSKIICKSVPDGTAGTCFFSGRKFETSKGIAFYFDDKLIHPDEVLSKNTPFEFADGFQSGHNCRAELTDYLQAIGVKRDHVSYHSVYSQLGKGLPLGEYKYKKPVY